MKENLTFVEFLFKDLLKNFKIHIEKNEIHDEEVKKFKNGERSYYPYDYNFRDKDCGKTALKRKITFLRQELLNLERMLDE